MNLVFATNNPHKVVEIRRLLPEMFTVKTLQDIGCLDDIPETADTIEGNAILKANYVYNHFGLNCFADDSGLEVQALDGAPGVLSARYAGAQKSDTDNMGQLLSAMLHQNNRKARFKTVIALNIEGDQHLFTGIIEGTITHQKSGTSGFGYDPIFQPDGFSKTFGQFSLDEKSAISHRAQAVKQLIAFLKNL